MAQPANGVRRPAGTGNIRQRSSGKFDVRIRLIDGQRYLGSFDTKEQAEAAIDAYQRQPILRLGSSLTVVREEIDLDGTFIYGIRDQRGNIWKLNLELWT